MDLRYNRVISVGIAFCISLNICASDLIEITPITNKILLLRINEGKVIYPDDLQMDRLDLSKALSAQTYSLSSTEDTELGTSVHPVDIGRKSKGTYFTSQAPWSQTNNGW